MKVNKLLMIGIAITMLLNLACNRKLPCSKIKTDKTHYRASGEAYAPKEDLAYEKALLIAKENLVQNIAKDISIKSGIAPKLINDSLNKGIKLSDLEIICKHKKKYKGAYRCSVAIEIESRKLIHFYH